MSVFRPVPRLLPGQVCMPPIRGIKFHVQHGRLCGCRKTGGMHQWGVLDTFDPYVLHLGNKEKPAAKAAGFFVVVRRMRAPPPAGVGAVQASARAPSLVLAADNL